MSRNSFETTRRLLIRRTGRNPAQKGAYTLRQELGRIVYWVIVHYVLSVVPQVRTIAPFVRVFLGADGGPLKAGRNARVWAEAILVSGVWSGVPWLCWQMIEKPLKHAGIIMPWIGDPGTGGAAFWWFVGVGLAFGVLQRSVLAAIIAAAIAFAWQWVMLGESVNQFIRQWPDGAKAIAPLLLTGATGLVVGIADVVAGDRHRRG